MRKWFVRRPLSAALVLGSSAMTLPVAQANQAVVAPAAAPKVELPAAPREMRGVWVATVENIDWPSKPGLPVEQQKAELLAILDKCAQLNLNAVVLQVRPACDAMYASTLE